MDRLCPFLLTCGLYPIRKIGLKAFTERYQNFCKYHGYNFQPCKPEAFFNASKNLVAVVPKDPVYNHLILSNIEQLNTISMQIEQFRRTMNKLALRFRNTASSCPCMA